MDRTEGPVLGHERAYLGALSETEWHALNYVSKVLSAVCCRLEFLEAANCGLLACTVAWDSCAQPGVDGAGFASFEAAALDARQALMGSAPSKGKAACALQVALATRLSYDSSHVLQK